MQINQDRMPSVAHSFAKRVRRQTARTQRVREEAYQGVREVAQLDVTAEMLRKLRRRRAREEESGAEASSAGKRARARGRRECV